MDGNPADVHDVVAGCESTLGTWEIPKLFVNADPGSILIGRAREVCRSWPNQTEVTVPGLHFMQEDSADLIGVALAGWYRSITVE